MNLLRPRLIIITGALVIGAVAVSVYYFVAPVRKAVIEREMQIVSENFAIGDLNPSIESLEKILTQNLSNDDRVRILIALATLYSQQGSLNFDEKESAAKALLLLEEALRLNPNNSEAARVMGYAHEISEDYAAATAYYEMAIEFDLNNAMAYSNLGHAYDLQGDLMLAAQNYKHALLIQNDLDHALLNLARVYVRNNDMDDARMYAEQTVKFSKNNRFISEAYNVLGVISLRENKLSEAETSFENAIKADERLANNYVGLVQVRFAMIESNGPDADINQIIKNTELFIQEAVPLIEKALSLNPNLSVAYITKAKILQMSGDFVGALAAIQQGSSAVSKDITLGALEKQNMMISMKDYAKNYQNLIKK